MTDTKSQLADVRKLIDRCADERATIIAALAKLGFSIIPSDFVTTPTLTVSKDDYAAIRRVLDK